MAAGWQGRWACFERVWLLGLGLMVTPAVAGTEGFVVEAERVKLSRAPDPDVLDPAALMLFRGEVCETSEPDLKMPWWSCRIQGQTVSGYAPRASFRPKTGEQEAAPPLPQKHLDEWLSESGPVKDPKRQDAFLFDGVLSAFSLEVRQCLEGLKDSEQACNDAITHRLMLHWTAHVIETPVPPSRPAKVLACSDGEALDRCLQRSLGPGKFASVQNPRQGRSTFVYVLQQPPRAVRFVTGKVPSSSYGLRRDAPGAYQLEVHADDSREDPLLLEVLRAMRRPFGVSFGLTEVLEARRYIIIVYPRDSRTFVTNRPLDRGFFAICGNETRKVEKPKLARVGLAFQGFVGTLYPTYHYELPCKASFVLDESIPGIRIGKHGPGRSCTVQKKEPAGATSQDKWPDPFILQKNEGQVPFTVRENPATGDCRVGLRNVRKSSRVVFSGDLNGDGRPDFILDLVGEMGCGGPRLYLSSPEGWLEAGLSNHYC